MGLKSQGLGKKELASFSQCVIVVRPKRIVFRKKKKKELCVSPLHNSRFEAHCSLLAFSTAFEMGMIIPILEMMKSRLPGITQLDQVNISLKLQTWVVNLCS